MSSLNSEHCLPPSIDLQKHLVVLNHHFTLLPSGPRWLFCVLGCIYLRRLCALSLLACICVFLRWTGCENKSPSGTIKSKSKQWLHGVIWVKLAFYFLTLFTLVSHTDDEMLRALCLRFYQIFLFDLVFMLQSPDLDSPTICKRKSVGTVSSNGAFPVCACITYCDT